MPEPLRVARGRVELACWRWPGSPPATLLLHGIGNYGRYWDFFADAVAGRLDLVAPDARGHGESGKPTSGYEREEFVADALAIMDALEWDRPLVVGHSMGGTHALRLAAAHGDRVGALVLVDVSTEPLPEGAGRARRLSLERPARFASDDEALAYLRRTSPGYSDAVYENRMRWVFAREGGGVVWRSSAGALAQIFGRTRVDLRAALAEVRCPVLVVRGTRSNVLAAETVPRMLATLQRGRAIELEAGHNVALDRPRELADAVVAFAREAMPG